MFKFIHAADLHLDSPLRGLARYETAPVAAIRGATRRAFENLVDLALDEDVSFVLLAGDLFDGEWKDHQTGIYFNRQMGRLAQNQVSVFVVAGNHDAASRVTKALSIKPPPNVTYLSVRQPQSIRLNELAVVIHGQGFKHQKNTENLAASYPLAERGAFNIGLLHTSLDGRQGHAPYAPCSLDDLRHKGYQYWALGHVHQREIVCTDPYVVFPGCLQGRHAKETGPKGCTVVSVEGQSVVGAEHHVLDVVRWSRCAVNAADLDREEQLNQRIRRGLEDALGQARNHLLALRVQVSGATRLDASLRAHPERWRHQIQAIGAELAAEQLWIEKVEISTRGKRDLADVLAGDDPLSRLLVEVVNHNSAGENVPGLDRVLDDLRAKLPPNFFVGEEAFDPASPAIVPELIEAAKALLVDRLLETEPAS